MNGKRHFAGRLTTGVLFLCAGITFLLNTFDVVEWGVWGELARWWPVLLITAGINVIFERGPAWPVVYLSPLAVAGVFAWVLTGYSPSQTEDTGWLSWLRGHRTVNLIQTELSSSAPDGEEVERVELEFATGAADITLGPADDDSAGPVVSVSAETGEPAPKIKDKFRDGKLSVEISRNEHIFETSSRKANYEVLLARGPAYDLEFDTGACDAELDLFHLVCDKMEINCGAADVRIVLPSSGEKESRIDVNSGASSVKLLLPPGVELTIERNGLVALSTDDVEERGGAYFAPGFYDGPPHRVHVEVNNGAGSIEIEPYKPSDDTAEVAPAAEPPQDPPAGEASSDGTEA
ncbi:MAG: hypothetical protein HRF49_12060 [bacterium]|jgi:hypothetical protein